MKIHITNEQRISLAERLARLADERSKRAPNPAMCAWYSEISRAYADFAHKLKQEFQGR